MAGLHFDITGDNSNFMEKLKQTENGIRQTSKSIEQSGLGIEDMFNRMTKAVAGLGAAFSAQQFASQVMKVRGEFQQLEVAFNTMLDSTEKAEALMSQLTRTAAITPFGLQDVAGGAKQLLAYGVASEKVNDTLIRLGDIASGLSIPLNDLVYLYGTTMTQGRLFTQDLRQFQGRGIPLADELAKQFGVAKDKVGELVTAGKVGFPEVEKAIVSMTSKGGKFGGLMEAQSKTIVGQISNIEDAIDSAFNQMGQSSEGVINAALGGVSSLVENWQKVADAIGYAASAYGAYKAAIMTQDALNNVRTGYSATEEIDSLVKLLEIKEDISNADLKEAVASGKLTQEKANGLAALRAEAMQRLEILNIKKQEAIAEEKSALNAFNIAKDEKDAADERLENMQNLYEAAMEQGDASYEAYAMEQLQTASASANTAATRLNTAERNLNTASTNAKSASLAADTFATNVNTAANHANTKSIGLMKAAALQLQGILRGMWATLMANPLAIVAASVGALAYGVYKFATRESEAEKATKNLNEALDSQSKKYDEQKREIDNLISTLGNLDVSEGERIGNLQKLKQQYPDILKDINIENEFLREKHKILQAINKEQGKQKQNDDIKLLEEAEKKLNHFLEVRKNGTDTSVVDIDGNGIATDNVVKAIQSQTEVVNELKAKVAEPVKNDFLESLKDLKDEKIDSVIEEITLSLQALEKEGDKAVGPITELGSEFSKGQMKEMKLALQGEKALRSGEKKSVNDWLVQYKKDYDAAEKELTRFRLQKTQMSEADFERKLKELTEKRDAAKKKYEDAGGSTKADDKRLDQERQKSKEILSILRDNQQNEINLMKEGSEKKIAQINHNYQKEIDAVKSQRQEWEDKQNGKLTKEQEEVLNKQKFNAEKTREKELADLKEKNLRDELQALYDYLQEYGTIQQQKYAIAKEYDMKIAKEQNDTRKKMLEKEKRTKLVSLDANNLAMGIDWGTAFEGVGTVLQGIAKETLKKVEEYMKTDEFKGLKAEDKKTYTELREKLRKETGEEAASPFNFKQWGIIANQVRDYQKAVENAKNAQNAHTLALKNLEKAEENLKNATTDTAKAIAKEKVKIAQGVVDSTASGQLEAEDKMNESKDNLTTSTNEAAQGISNFASYLNEMSNGSLYGFANGITKLITSLGKGSDGVGKSLEALGGKIGGIIGAILQILDALGDAPAKFIDDLLRNVANAVEAILTDLPKIIGSVVKGVGNIVGSIFTGIASWFGFGKGDRKKENRIKEYQKQIDGLEKTYQRLEKEVDALYSNVAKAKIEAQNENLKQQKALIQRQISEEEKKKKTDNDKIAEWKEQIESIDETIKENREAAKDAIFGSDIQSAIDDFASAYVDAWSAGEDKAKSAKNVVKDMIKGMITESIKAASSDPMKAIREKLLAFWSDEYISGWEQDYLDKMVTDLQKELDNKFGWADSFMGNDSSYSQEASSKGFEAMSQETGEELNGRFTALQIAGEEIKNQMIQSVVLYTQMLSLTSQNNSVLNDILAQQALSNAYLADIAKYSKVMSAFGEKIDNIVENTKNL